MDNDSGILKETKDVLTDDQHPLGERASGTPFALVALSYLGILAIASIALGILFWLT